MTTRNIYFVRHGETDANVAGTAQTSDSRLTDKGKDQAKVVAERMKNFKLTTVLTSELIRAADTGTQIADHHNIPIIQLGILNERIKPSSVFGLSHSDPKYIEYFDRLINSAHDIDYRYEDGENIYDLVVRTKRILEFIEQETKGDVVVVSHGVLLRIIVAYILTKSEDLSVYAEAFKNLHIDNTGITHALIKDRHWMFGTINDSTHLS